MPEQGRPSRTDQPGQDDVAALRAVQTQLSRALALSAKVLHNTADGIYGLDAAGRVEFVNPAAVRITGHPADEQLGNVQHELIHGRRPDGSSYPATECPIWQALRTGRTVAVQDEVFWHRDGRAVPVEVVAVPTVEDDAVTGVVVSFRDRTDQLAAEAQAAELRRLARQAAEERALSDRLQQALLTPPPEPDHLHVVVRYQPAASGAQVGGDWYDAFLQPDGATVLVIGDVVGHDSTAAASMGQLRGLLRALAYDNDEDLPATLTRVEHAAQGLAVATMATAVLARIERRPDVPVTGTRVLRWTNAGHPPPVLLLADGSTTVLETRPDLMLGVDPDAPRHGHEAVLPDGSTLLLFTDGLVEGSGSDLDRGVAALRAALSDLCGAPLDELCDSLLTRLVPEHGADDVALVAVRAHPEDRPRPAEAGPNVLPDGIDRPPVVPRSSYPPPTVTGVPIDLTRADVLGARVRAQQLDRPAGTLADTAVLDLGVQDTGPDGGLWALAVRGVDVAALDDDALATVWTLRGAPHLYRRADLPGVAAATAPFSDADAGKRIFDAAKPLKAAGIPNLTALDTVAATMRSIVTEPTVKGEMSRRLTEQLDDPYLRYCVPCAATHVHEMPFRLAALRAGLELQPGTSPPVLQRIPGFTVADTVPERLDVVRAYLRLYGPATPKHVAGYLDAPVADVTARWPDDVVEVSVDGERRWVLAADADRLTAGPATTTRLLGPFDPYLQTRDRPLLVADPARAKALWPTLGRPGAVLVDGEVVGTWRPRKAGKRLKVQLELWDPVPPAAREEISGQAQRLATYRQLALADVEVTG